MNALAPYRKLIAALVGLALMMLHRHTGIDLSGQEAAYVDGVIALITLGAIYFARNGEPARGHQPEAAPEGKSANPPPSTLSIAILALILATMLPGCESLKTLAAPAPLPPVSSALPPVGQEAQKLLNEAHIALAAAANVIRVNLREGIWTPEEALRYRDTVRAYRNRALQAQELLDGGLFAPAHTQARLLETAILELQRQVAAAARKENAR